MKPRIFIGSSKEGLDVAQYIKSSLGDEFDCYLWNDDLFQYNESALEALLKEASLFDFGLLVATKDDFTTSRNQNLETPRDNVIFEFGLFLGRLGPERSFVIQEKEAKLPSDLLGVTIPRFEKTDNLADSTSLNSEIEKIKKTVKDKHSLSQLGLLPSTALVVGYFYNFVSIACEYLQSCSYIEADGKNFNKFELNIVIPKSIDDDIKKRADIFFKKNNLKQIPLNTQSRNFPVFMTYDALESDLLKLYDMPTTIYGIKKSIEMYLKKSYVGKTKQEELLEDRELSNFQNTLQFLIDNNAYCKDLVKIIEEE